MHKKQYLHPVRVKKTKQETWVYEEMSKKDEKEKEWDKVDQAAKLIFNMASAPHKRPKKPNKKDLNRKFSFILC